MYSYISENNFGPSKQIIVPTGYNVKYRCNDILQQNPELRQEKPVPVSLDFLFYKEDTYYVRLKAIMAVTMETCLLRILSNHSTLK